MRYHSFGPVELPPGKIFRGRWKVLDRIGQGGCGSVYLVEDINSHAKAALKAESNFVSGGSVLKLEVEVLKRMRSRKFVAQLICSGKKVDYGYMITTLLGTDLLRLFKQCKYKFSMSTQVRLGIQILYGLKQLHEVGYVHRDVKPGNFAMGRNGLATRMVHLLDFGLSREYVSRNGDKVAIRQPRKKTFFRGTPRYCSIDAHLTKEQGRHDDLWSMIYMLVEMRGTLPWDRLRDKNEIAVLKRNVTDKKLLSNCPPQFSLITAHLRTLNYHKRPGYQLIFEVLHQIMNKYNIRPSDPFDWEWEARHSSLMKFIIPCRASNILTVSEDSSATQSAERDTKSLELTEEDTGAFPFALEDFSKNEIGL